MMSFLELHLPLLTAEFLQCQHRFWTVFENACLGLRKWILLLEAAICLTVVMKNCQSGERSTICS